MADLLARPSPPDANGRTLSITPESAGWTYVGFDLYRLEAGQTLERSTGEQEVLLVLIAGSADITAAGQSFENLGGRKGPFDDVSPDSVYVPAGSSYTVMPRTTLELAVCAAPGKPGTRKPVLIPGASVPTETRGESTNTRHVRNILPDSVEGIADSLIVVEVITPSGCWSSYPPHKHDTDDVPNESYLEEIYYHRLDPSQGFAFQRVYTDSGDLDETMTVHDGDVTMVPKGYHPCGAPHGYALCYLNVMAGPRRVWKFTTQAQHQWLLK
ncbi:5-deoxy-glucuronate isomerase [Fodinicurvata sp. EGI_FJ10296]|uniref:5-deoxy-glucuronate isomerase n=1 Tax=Fodinicurvata sp. EGI_FJ10296 TaxID=3231908 RepID=UPI00345605AA